MNYEDQVKGSAGVRDASHSEGWGTLKKGLSIKLCPPYSHRKEQQWRFHLSLIGNMRLWLLISYEVPPSPIGLWDPSRTSTSPPSRRLVHFNKDVPTYRRIIPRRHPSIHLPPQPPNVIVHSGQQGKTIGGWWGLQATAAAQGDGGIP